MARGSGRAPVPVPLTVRVAPVSPFIDRTSAVSERYLPGCVRLAVGSPGGELLHLREVSALFFATPWGTYVRTQAVREHDGRRSDELGDCVLERPRCAARPCVHEHLRDKLVADHPGADDEIEQLRGRWSTGRFAPEAQAFGHRGVLRYLVVRLSSDLHCVFRTSLADEEGSRGTCVISRGAGCVAHPGVGACLADVFIAAVPPDLAALTARPETVTLTARPDGFEVAGVAGERLRFPLLIGDRGGPDRTFEYRRLSDPLVLALYLERERFVPLVRLADGACLLCDVVACAVHADLRALAAAAFG